MERKNNLPNIEYKKTLYVTDLSEAGRQAFPHAASIARRFQSKLTVFHVVSTKNMENLLGYVNDELWEDLTRQSLEDARKVLLSRKRENTDIQTELEQYCEDSNQQELSQDKLVYEVKVKAGEPLEKILEEAHSGDYDLLVISKHGNRASVKDAIIGDTARRIVRRSKIPVMTIPAPE